MDERERVLLTLAGMRALMGIVWLSLLLGKLPPDFGRHDRDGLMHTFFGYVIVLVELVAGVLLLTGFSTRLGAWLGLSLAILMVIFLGPAPHTWRFALVLFVAWHVVLLATPCARRLSLDDRLGRDP